MASSCSSSSSNSPSSSAVASWYCWYSDTKSLMLLSASVNSISSIPSPVYQCKKAFRLNIAVNCSLILLNNSWIAVLFPMKVAAVLVLHIQHLFIDFFHGHSSSEHGGHSQVSSVSWITSGHHILSIEHLLGQLWNSQSSVLLATSGGQWSETWHKEVQPWEWNHVDSQFPQIGVQLTWEPQASGNTGHGGADQMVQVSVGCGGEFQSSETDVVESFVINTVSFIGVFDQLVD